MWLRRTASASARPAGAVERLAEAAERALAAVASQQDNPVPFQGKVLSAGDFVRRCRQIVDLLGQVAQAGDASGDRSVARAARSAMQAVDRGVVAGAGV